MTRAVAVFSGDAGIWWLRLLKPGFRHCFVAVEVQGGWVVVEPMSHYTMVTHLSLPAGFDLAGWYRTRGLAAVEVRVVEPARRAMPWRPYSCVEAAKRVLGVRAGWVLTPWQLFRFLRNKGKKALTAMNGRSINPSINATLASACHRPGQVGGIFAYANANKTRSSSEESAMGGFFSSPSSPPPPPPPPAPVANPEDEARKQRLEAIARNRRGRQGLIATSERGLLDAAGQSTKKLLGE